MGGNLFLCLTFDGERRGWRNIAGEWGTRQRGKTTHATACTSDVDWTSWGYHADGSPAIVLNAIQRVRLTLVQFRSYLMSGACENGYLQTVMRARQLIAIMQRGPTPDVRTSTDYLCTLKAGRASTQRGASSGIGLYERRSLSICVKRSAKSKD